MSIRIVRLFGKQNILKIRSSIPMEDKMYKGWSTDQAPIQARANVEFCEGRCGALRFPEPTVQA